MSESTHDPVNHPSHYTFGKIEVIEAIEDWKLGFNLGNAIKYIARAEHKGRMLEDLEKAKWYLEREIDKRSERIKPEIKTIPPVPDPCVACGHAKQDHLGGLGCCDGCDECRRFRRRLAISAEPITNPMIEPMTELVTELMAGLMTELEK